MNERIPNVRESGNYASDEQKELAKLKHKLRDAKDAFAVLKNHQHSGKMTAAICLKTKTAKKTGHQVCVSGMLKLLGVSHSGYNAWLHQTPSDTEKRRVAVKEKYKISTPFQNKITEHLRLQQNCEK